MAAFYLGKSTALVRTATGGDIRLGSLSGGSTTSLAGATNSANLTNYVVNARNENITFSGTILDGPFSGAKTSLTKTGTGTWRLFGSLSYSGDTNVNGGTLYPEPSAVLLVVAGIATVGRYCSQRPRIRDQA